MFAIPKNCSSSVAVTLTEIPPDGIQAAIRHLREIDEIVIELRPDHKDAPWAQGARADAMPTGNALVLSQGRSIWRRSAWRGSCATCSMVLDPLPGVDAEVGRGMG